MTNEALPKPGTKLGDFELQKIIGKGGFGAVYRAHQAWLNREVAVKVILPSAMNRDPLAVKRFFREVDIVRRLEHPNSVRLYDYGQEESGLLWMATELVRGPTLRTLIGQAGRLDAPRARRITLQILSALVQAHELGIIHRDIKPGNVMLTRAGADEDVVKLLDFGISKALGSSEDAFLQQLTQANEPAYGTPLYMAPEQLTGGEVGPAADVFSTALVHYEMLTGRSPYQGSTAFEIISHRLKHPIDFPPEFIADPQRAVLERALADEVEARYPSAREFHSALAALDASPLAGPAVDDEWARRARMLDPNAQTTGESEIIESPPSFVFAPSPFAASLGTEESASAKAVTPTQSEAPPSSAAPLPGVDAAPRPAQTATKPRVRPPAQPALELALLPEKSSSVATTRVSPMRSAASRAPAPSPRRVWLPVLALVLVLAAAGGVGYVLVTRASEGAASAPAVHEPAPTAEQPRTPREACDAGDLEACLSVGSALADLHGVERDDEGAAALFRRACDGGRAVGCGLLGAMMAEGRGVIYDPPAAVPLLERACNAEHWPSCHLLGVLYEGDRGVAADAEQAKRFLGLACANALYDACR